MTFFYNKVTNFDQTSGIVVCESGVVLQALEQYLSPHGLTIPIDLAAKGTHKRLKYNNNLVLSFIIWLGSCCVGGNISTNAGGIRLLRYGSLHGIIVVSSH